MDFLGIDHCALSLTELSNPRTPRAVLLQRGDGPQSRPNPAWEKTEKQTETDMVKDKGVGMGVGMGIRTIAARLDPTSSAMRGAFYKSSLHPSSV